jgi:hypothetical protein
MSRRLWRCRDPECGIVLGRLTGDAGLILVPAVQHLHVYIDTGRSDITCPACGTVRSFRGRSIGTTGRVP